MIPSPCLHGIEGHIVYPTLDGEAQGPSRKSPRPRKGPATVWELLIAIAFCGALIDSLSAVLPTPARHPQAGYACSQPGSRALPVPNAAGGGQPAERELKARGQRWSRSTHAWACTRRRCAPGAPGIRTWRAGPGCAPPPQDSPERSPDAALAPKQRGVPRLPGHAQPASRSPPGAAHAPLRPRLRALAGAPGLRATGPLEPRGR